MRLEDVIVAIEQEGTGASETALFLAAADYIERNNPAALFFEDERVKERATARIIGAVASSYAVRGDFASMEQTVVGLFSMATILTGARLVVDAIKGKE